MTLASMVGFQWDDANTMKIANKHHVQSTECEQVFFNQPLFVIEDSKHSQTEMRYHALGKTNAGRLLLMAFTVRGNAIRIISARPMNRKERRFYEQEA